MVYHSPYDNWVVLSPIYPKQQVLFYCSIGVLKSFQIQLQEKNMETSNPLNLMIKRELHLAIRRQSQNDTWDANPSHPMPLACWTALQMYNIFLYKIHRSWALICYLWRNKRPPEKNHLLETWFRLWDRHRPCWGPAWDDNEAHSETWKCHPWRVPRWATCCLGFLKKDFDPTRIVCFNILKLVLTFYSYSLFTMEIYNRIFCVVLVLRPPPCLKNLPIFIVVVIYDLFPRTLRRVSIQYISAFKFPIQFSHSNKQHKKDKRKHHLKKDTKKRPHSTTFHISTVKLQYWLIKKKQQKQFLQTQPQTPNVWHIFTYIWHHLAIFLW